MLLVISASISSCTKEPIDHPVKFSINIPINNWVIPPTQVGVVSAYGWQYFHSVDLNLNIDSLYKVYSNGQNVTDRKYYFGSGCTLSFVSSTDSSSLKNFTELHLLDNPSGNTDSAVISFIPSGNVYTNFPITINLYGDVLRSTTSDLTCNLNLQITFEGKWTEWRQTDHM